ncbi:hypothetical protein [Nonomuraea gerenzanensis]|uniref:Uncharacterized protein n=1 Tax=Nonomuraea gerenzanensis TaxID=93944 RepID=A0A1M4EB89_9ACTN|nr:hypothetical protein [Nonomuraea gerenzanensis]UBU18148.1 hypothetical protein LCN96_24920 [Nonomuraea gerenzanensis]SBO95958.1 hypothetical protein BN4615_P5474 [Nonomuraea gerenzanensis]
MLAPALGGAPLPDAFVEAVFAAGEPAQLGLLATNQRLLSDRPSLPDRLAATGQAPVARVALELVSARQPAWSLRARRRGLSCATGVGWAGPEGAMIPLSGLRHRLSGRRAIGIRDLAAEAGAWEARLAAAGKHDEGGADSDTVHQIFADAEVSQLREHLEVVARLLPYLPPKLRATYLVGQPEDKQRLWVDAFAMMAAR